jgi:hypothetical protein
MGRLAGEMRGINVHTQNNVRRYFTHAKVLHEHCADVHNCCGAPKSCDRFVPGLRFGVGIDGLTGEFNTMRVGSAWLHRLIAGQRVGLLGKAGNCLGYALVTHVEAGPKQDMLTRYAAENHVFKGRYYAKIPMAERAASLNRTLRNMYGSMIYTNATVLTVIRLRRTDG